MEYLTTVEDMIDFCEDELSYGNIKEALIKLSDNFGYYDQYKKFIDCLRKCDVDVNGYPVYYTGNRDFTGTKLEEVIILGTIKELKEYSFSMCSKLKRVEIE